MGIDIAFAVDTVIHDLAMARQNGDGTCQLLVLNLALNNPVQIFQPFA